MFISMLMTTNYYFLQMAARYKRAGLESVLALRCFLMCVAERLQESVHAV